MPFLVPAHGFCHDRLIKGRTVSPPADADTQAEAQRLAEAFQIFNQASEELSTAYTALQAQVAQLTTELAAANGALRQQYLEKLALTERLALLLDALPAGVVLIGEGIVWCSPTQRPKPSLGMRLPIYPGWMSRQKPCVQVVFPMSIGWVNEWS